MLWSQLGMMFQKLLWISSSVRQWVIDLVPWNPWEEQSLCEGLSLCSGGWSNSECNLICSGRKPLTEMAGSLAGGCSRVIMAPGCRASKTVVLIVPWSLRGRIGRQLLCIFQAPQRPREAYAQVITGQGMILSIMGRCEAVLLSSGWSHGIVSWSQLEESDLTKSQNGSFVKCLQMFTGSLPLTYCLSKYFFYKGLQQTVTTQNKNYLLPRVTYP